MNNMHVFSNGKSLLRLLRRYHFVLFTVLMALVLSLSVLLLYDIVIKASGVDSVPQSSVPASNFDQETINRINSLKTSNEPSTPLDLSRGRINPFTE